MYSRDPRVRCTTCGSMWYVSFNSRQFGRPRLPIVTVVWGKWRRVVEKDARTSRQRHFEHACHVPIDSRLHSGTTGCQRLENLHTLHLMRYNPHDGRTTTIGGPAPPSSACIVLTDRTVCAQLPPCNVCRKGLTAWKRILHPSPGVVCIGSSARNCEADLTPSILRIR